jgi:hypothetical protein
MRLSLVLAAIAYIGLFIAGQVHAAPSQDFCLENPESPLCGGPIDPPVDPDPCDEDPSLCEPPTGPCELAPELCQPGGPVLEPGDPAEPVAPLVFTGSVRFKGPGFLTSRDIDTTLVHDDTTFALGLAGGCSIGTGGVVAKGQSGKKFELLFDDASLDSFTNDLVHMAALLSGQTGTPIAETAKVVLKRTGEDTWSLKIKFSVVVQGVGVIVYKANLTSTTAAPPEPSSVRCLQTN